jgi:phage-related protein (TIGR01555 family)
MATTDTRLNSLADLALGLNPDPYTNPYQSQTISQPWTLAISNSYTPLSLNRILLSYSYMTQGLVQTIVGQPVDDAFRGGITITSDELSPEDLAVLQTALKRSRKQDKATKFVATRVNPNAGINLGNSDMRIAMDVLKWARLYGGAGLIINTDQNYATELRPEAITADSPLEFIAADRWELILSQTNIFDPRNPCPFNFYGLPLHRSRVIKVLGIEAPSYIRLRLQGWGMSEIERCIRSINSFVKFENLIFELLDEAKIDVYKIQGFNDALLTDDGTANTKRRVQLGNQLKNYQNALAMDAEDDYHQKQIIWSGLAEIWNELRLNLSSALKIPMNKLFGQSATGFGGGQDALENYNSIVEQVRADAEPVIQEIIDLRCQQLFGFIPEYTVSWKPLKVLDGVEEEAVKTSKQKRAMELFQQRLVTGREVTAILRNEDLLTMETEVGAGLRDVEPVATSQSEPSDSSVTAGDKEEKKSEMKPKK